MNKNDLSVISIDGHPPIGVFDSGSHVILFNLPNLGSIYTAGTGNLFPEDARGVSSVMAEFIKARVERDLGRTLARRELVEVRFSQDATGLVRVAEQNAWEFDPDFFSQRMDGPFMPVEVLMDRLMLRNSRVARSVTPILPEQRVGEFGKILGMRGDSDYVGVFTVGPVTMPIDSSDELRLLASVESYEAITTDLYDLKLRGCSVQLSSEEMRALAEAASRAVADLVHEADASNPVQDVAAAQRLMTDLERFTLAATQIYLAQQTNLPVPTQGMPDEDVNRRTLTDLGHLMTVTSIGMLIAQQPQVAIAVFTGAAVLLSAHEVGRAKSRIRGDKP